MGPLLAEFWAWASRWFAAAQPQRADFESVSKQWETLVASLTARVDAEAKARDRDREYFMRRIAELQAESEECRKDREADLARMEKLEETIRSLRKTVDELEWTRKMRADAEYQQRTEGQVERLVKEGEPK